MKQNNNNFNDFDEEDRQLVLDFENTVMQGGMQFFDVDELEVIIDYYFEVNDMKPLEKAVEYAEQLYPDSSTIRLRRAHLLIAQQQYDAALDIIQQLRRQEPDNTDVAYSLGVAYSAVGESRKAIKYFLEAADDGWMLGRVYSNIAEEYYNLRDFDEAIRYYHLAMDTDSYDAATIYNYLDTCMQAQRAEGAIEYLKSFVGEHPYSCEAWHCLGTAYLSLGLSEQAIDAYEYALAIDKRNMQVNIDLAAAQESIGAVGNAVTTLLRAIDYADNKAALYRMVAFIYMRANNSDMAIIYFRKAIEEDAEDAESYAALAVVYAVIDDFSNAIPNIKKALRLAPENPDVLCSAGVIYDTMGNLEAAEDYYERMVDCETCSEEQCQHYVQFLYNAKNFETLIDFAVESLEIYPQHPFYSTYLVAASFYTNRYNRASRSLPYVSPSLLHEICPEIFSHPRLAPLIPDDHSLNEDNNLTL